MAEPGEDVPEVLVDEAAGGVLVVLEAGAGGGVAVVAFELPGDAVVVLAEPPPGGEAEGGGVPAEETGVVVPVVLGALAAAGFAEGDDAPFEGEAGGVPAGETPGGPGGRAGAPFEDEAGAVGFPVAEAPADAAGLAVAGDTGWVEPVSGLATPDASG